MGRSPTPLRAPRSECFNIVTGCYKRWQSILGVGVDVYEIIAIGSAGTVSATELMHGSVHTGCQPRWRCNHRR